MKIKVTIELDEGIKNTVVIDDGVKLTSEKAIMDKRYDSEFKKLLVQMTGSAAAEAMKETVDFLANNGTLYQFNQRIVSENPDFYVREVKKLGDFKKDIAEIKAQQDIPMTEVEVAERRDRWNNDVRQVVQDSTIEEYDTNT